MSAHNLLRIKMLTKKLACNNKGVGMIETAILLPILLAIIFAGIEFGFYFSNRSVMQNAVGAVASTIQTYSPNVTNSEATSLNNTLHGLYGVLGSGSVEFKNTNFCGKAFSTESDAKDFVNGNPCASGSPGFKVGRANAGVTSDQPYYVGLVASVGYNAFTPMSGLSGVVMPDNVVSKLVIYVSPSFGSGSGSGSDLPTGCSEGQVLKIVGGAWTCGNDSTSSGSGSGLPTGCLDGQVVKLSGGAWSCGNDSTGSGSGVSIPSSCSASGKVLEWNGSSWICGTDDTSSSSSGLPTPPVCSAGNQKLSWSGAAWSCDSPVPSCPTGSAVTGNGISWSCISAGGATPLSCKADEASYWDGSAWKCRKVPPVSCPTMETIYWDGSAWHCVNSKDLVSTGGGRGGIYMKGKSGSSSTCRFTNPLTNACSCPSGYTAYQFWDFWGKDSFYENSGSITMYQCIK